MTLSRKKIQNMNTNFTEYDFFSIGFLFLLFYLISYFEEITFFNGLYLLLVGIFKH